MKIAITGSTGFFGRNLVPKLLQHGHDLIEITRNELKSLKLYGENTLKINASENHAFLKEKLESFQPEIFVHLAAHISSSDDFDNMNRLMESNLVFFTRILDALKHAGLKLFINTGTFAELNFTTNQLDFDPAYLYAATKTASRPLLDYYSKTYQFKQITIIPYTVYGGVDSQKKIIDLLIDSLETEFPVDLSPGDQVLDFIHVDDVTDFYIKVIEHINELPPKCNYHLGTGEGHNLKQLSSIIESLMRKKVNANWGGRDYRKNDVMYAVAPKHQELSEIIGWKPKFNLQTGILKQIKPK